MSDDKASLGEMRELWEGSKGDPHDQRRESFEGYEETAFNAETLRAAAVMPFGIACYQCTIEKDKAGNSHVVGTHAGFVGTVDAANAWLRGETPPELKQLYNEKDIEGWREEEVRRLKMGYDQPLGPTGPGPIINHPTR